MLTYGLICLSSYLLNLPFINTMQHDDADVWLILPLYFIWQHADVWLNLSVISHHAYIWLNLSVISHHAYIWFIVYTMLTYGLICFIFDTMLMYGLICFMFDTMFTYGQFAIYLRTMLTYLNMYDQLLLSFLVHLSFRPCELLSSLFVCRPSVNI